MLGQVPWLQSAPEKTVWLRKPGQLRARSTGKTSPSQSEMGQRAHEAGGHIAPPVCRHQVSPAPHLQGCVPTDSSWAETSLSVPLLVSQSQARPVAPETWSPLMTPERKAVSGPVEHGTVPGPPGAAAVSQVSLSSITCTAGRSASRWLRSPAAQGCPGTGPGSRGWRRLPGAPRSSRPSPASRPPPLSYH